MRYWRTFTAKAALYVKGQRAKSRLRRPTKTKSLRVRRDLSSISLVMPRRLNRAALWKSRRRQRHNRLALLQRSADAAVLEAQPLHLFVERRAVDAELVGR